MYCVSIELQKHKSKISVAKYFFTCHGEQNGRSLERCALLLATWQLLHFWKIPQVQSHQDSGVIISLHLLFLTNTHDQIWFSTNTFTKFYQGIGVTRAKSRKSKGIRRDLESREQRISNWDRFIVVEENMTSPDHFLWTEMSQCYRTHPGGQRRVRRDTEGVVIRCVWRESAAAVFKPQGYRHTNCTIASDTTVRVYHECNVLCSNTDILVLLPAQQDLCQEI